MEEFDSGDVVACPAPAPGLIPGDPAVPERTDAVRACAAERPPAIPA
jgi:hypothetical protein